MCVEEKEIKQVDLDGLTHKEVVSLPFSEKQQVFLENACKRWNFKSGATRSGKT